MKNCLNCQTMLPEGAKFCPTCGQKSTDGKISITEFFSIFFDTYFNVDSSVFKTAFGLFVPGKLTMEFFEGKHKSYLHPMRIFLLMAAFFIAVFSFQINGFLSDKADNMSKSVHGYFVKNQVLNEIDSIHATLLLDTSNCVDTSFVDTLRSIYETNILDSLNGSENISFSGAVRNIPIQEFYKSSVPELVEKYEVTEWEEVLLMSQMKRFIDAPSKYIQTIIGNLIWMILLLMPAIALFLKLYYFRNGFYFVEHLVFSFHFNAFAFFLVGMVTWISDGNGRMFFLANFVAAIFLFFALKRYYQQSIGKTFSKWMLILFTYFIITTILSAGLLTISFAMF